MAKSVADLLVERLVDWEVDTIFGFPGDGVNGIFEALERTRTRSDLSRSVMKSRPLSPHAAMPNTPAASASASPPRDPAASTSSTASTTRNATASPSWRSPGTRSTTSSAPTINRTWTSTNFSWTSRPITSA